MGHAKCPCGRDKWYCKIHGSGKAFCSCGSRKDRCEEHGGRPLCHCGKRKDTCEIHRNNNKRAVRYRDWMKRIYLPDPEELQTEVGNKTAANSASSARG